jgi:hypothetical protein
MKIRAAAQYPTRTKVSKTSDSLSDVDIQWLLALDNRHEDHSRKERDEIQANSMYLFVTNNPWDAFNDEMLLKAN